MIAPHYKRIFITIAICFGYLVASSQEDFFRTPQKGIVSWLPVTDWNHALISGNGTLGALVFGNPHDETIILNHTNLYLPQKRSARPIDQASRLEEIRNLILQGKYAEASKIPVAIREAEGYSDARDPFIPAFDLRIKQTAANVKRYHRTVNFETGVVAVTWEDDRGIFQRNVFVSRADSVVVVQLKGNTKITGSLQFQHRPVEWTQWQFVSEGIAEMKPSASDEWLLYSSNFKIRSTGSIIGYEGVGKILVNGGTSEVKNGEIFVNEADEVLVLLDIRTRGDDATQSTSIQKRLTALDENYTRLLQRHEKIHGELFRRTSFSLGGTTEDHSLFTEALLLKAKQEVPLALIEKTFDAGRYAILSATGINPPNLQGLWSGTWTAPWTGGFTHDGNLATAIAILLPGNMPELMDAFFRYHEKLITEYRTSAKTLYKCRGIHIPAQSTTSGWETDFNETWCLTFWTGAAGWTAHFFFDYYQYTGDVQFLRDRAYPFMKEAVLFYEDFLTKDASGKFVFNPSYSPENNPGNSHSQAALNATMDVMIAKQLLRNCIQAAEVLKTDKEKVEQWKNMLASMPDYQVNEAGVLKEWLSPSVNENFKHRHASHLYALYYGVAEEFKNKKLETAAIRAMEERMKFREAEGGGEMAFGLVQLASVAAHLKQTEKAHTLVKWLASNYWSTGLGSFHNVGNLFNTDISGGLPYVITQLLTYSEPGFLSLLPALPSAWKEGSIEGVLLRGQLKLKKLKWLDTSVEVVLISFIDQTIVIEIPAAIGSLTSSIKGAIKRDKLKNRISLTLKANEPISLTFN